MVYHHRSLTVGPIEKEHSFLSAPGEYKSVTGGPALNEYFGVSISLSIPHNYILDNI